MTTASAVLAFFEYAITVDREVELFWKRKVSGATALFFANRYLIIMYSALLLAANFSTVPWTDRVSVRLYICTKYLFEN